MVEYRQGWSDMAGRFVLKKGQSGKFHFNLVAGNGQVIATSEAYNSKEAALNGIESVRKNSLDAEVEDAFPIDLDRLQDAYEQAVVMIQSDSRAQRAFESATALADKLRAFANDAADLRAQAAARIAKEEKLSLAVLAGRISTSKARAAQLIKVIEEGNPSQATDERSSASNA
jgi:hypothetical protein